MFANNLFLYQRRLIVLLTLQKINDRQIDDYQEDWARQEVSFVLREPVSICDMTIARIKELFSAHLVILIPQNNSLKVVIHGSLFPLVH
jgi:hypothetical protein